MSLAMAVPDKSAAEIVPISWVKRIGSRVCTNAASDGDVCENGPIRTYNLGSRSEADPPTDWLGRALLQNSHRPWISAGQILCCGFFGFGHELSSKCLICAHLRIARSHFAIVFLPVALSSYRLICSHLLSSGQRADCILTSPFLLERRYQGLSAGAESRPRHGPM